MQNLRIKPCPYCGGKATTKKSYISHWRADFGYVICEKCGARGRTVYIRSAMPEECKKKAIEYWNMRTSDNTAISDTLELQDENNNMSGIVSKVGRLQSIINECDDKALSSDSVVTMAAVILHELENVASEKRNKCQWRNMEPW